MVLANTRRYGLQSVTPKLIFGGGESGGSKIKLGGRFLY